MINLVVGSPGHGKTQFMIAKILEMIKDNEKLTNQGKQPRQIFCDIKDLLIPEVEPAPDDWRDAPDGSIIIYDEVQYRKEYEYKGNQYSQDQMIKDLTIHRHTNKDLWLITQDPARLEKGIHKLIDRMYYIKRPASKPKYTNVFEFDKWLSNPDPASNRNAKHKKYLDFYRFNFDDKYQKLYKSATDHTSIKFKLPKQLFTFLFIILAIIAFALFALLNTDSFDTDRFQEKAEKDKTQETTTIKPVLSNTNEAQKDFDLNLECRKGENVDKPECIKWFDDLTKNNLSVEYMTANGFKPIDYDVNKPYEIENISYNYQVQQSPQLTGCAIVNNKCTCFTQQATKLDVSQSDCKRYMNGDKPFNPFLPTNQNQGVNNASYNNQGNNSLSSQQDSPQISLEEYAKYQEYKRITQEYQRSQPQQQNEISHGFG